MCFLFIGLITIFKNIMKKKALKGKIYEATKENDNAAM